MKSKTIYTIGHSTRSIEDFTHLLKTYEIEQLVDIRTIPKSKHNPQFNSEDLFISLKKENIQYIHLEKLGGLRHTTKDSINLGWRNSSFRGFADYMQTDPFWEGIEELEKLGKKCRTTLMCAEALPWRCHRSLIADVLTIKKWKVFHILNEKNFRLHSLTPFLQVVKGKLTYPEKKTE